MAKFDNMKYKSLFPKALLLISFVMILYSCIRDKSSQPLPPPNVQKMKQPLEHVNIQLVKTEEEEIIDYMKRYDWYMNKTGTGLRYMIYKTGSGKRAENGKIVKINYEVRLINGKVIYSSNTDKQKEFVLGKSNAEQGLEEGLLFLRVGGKAKFIIPSHLAYGLHGDDNKIPKRATLIYDVELVEVREK